MELDEGRAPKRRRTNADEAGPYILRTLAENIQLAAEEEAGEDPEITSVEFWRKYQDNLASGWQLED